MILRINNLGIIEKAEIDISKPFILFTGPNGTGKTYLSYLIHQLPASFGGYLLSLIRKDEDRKMFNIYDPALLYTVDSVQGTLDPEELFYIFKKGIEEISLTIINQLNLVDLQMDNFSLELVSSLDEWKKELNQLKLNCGFFLKIHKDSGTYDYSVTSIPEFRDRPEAKRNDNFELALFLDSLFFSGASNAMMLTAERSGIALFSTEIAVGRLRGEGKPPRYPSAIADGLAEAADRSHNSKYMSNFSDLADEIEKEVLHGKVVINENGELRLSKEGKEYDIAVASSTAKALADMVFYIRYKAELMSRLLIDEPEIHLHPDNQIILARIFARMVNRGLQILISTHSEYIIREINILIMLSNSGEDFKKRASELGYKSEEFLKPELIQPYLFVVQENGKVKTEAIDVSKEGFAVKSIDRTIASLNDISEEVYYAMLQNQYG